MGTKSRGRGLAALFGFLVLFAGAVGAVWLYLDADGLPDEAVDSYARAVVGCTTELDFEETGTFYVFEERGASDAQLGPCAPVATPDQTLAVELVATQGAPSVEPVADATISYESGELVGTSIVRLDITEAGQYDLRVTGPDPAVRAAIGRDPDTAVSEQRRGALLVGLAGLVLGGLLLLLAGRRSKRAATASVPVGPRLVEGSVAGPGPGAWPPAPPSVPQVPVFPHRPDGPVVPAPPPSPLPAREPGASSVRPPWAPPAAGTSIEGSPAPSRDSAVVPRLSPSLPDRRRARRDS